MGLHVQGLRDELAVRQVSAPQSKKENVPVEDAGSRSSHSWFRSSRRALLGSVPVFDRRQSSWKLMQWV
jgi:hypothetical protein